MSVKKIFAVCLAFVAFASVQASWYWPFGNEDAETPRLSKLMAGVTEAIEAAMQRVAQNDIDGAVGKYGDALIEIAKVREKYPQLEGGPEFMSLRNREAYVEVAIESLLMRQVVENASTVAVTDTAALEKRLADEERVRAGEQGQANAEIEPVKVEPEVSASAKAEPSEKSVKGVRAKPKTRDEWIDFIDEDIGNGDYETAALAISELLERNPNDSAILNLRAALEVARGEIAAAEDTLLFVIQKVEPRVYAGYYNLARLSLMKSPPNYVAAAQYYKTGRLFNGPQDSDLESQLTNELRKIGYFDK